MSELRFFLRVLCGSAVNLLLFKRQTVRFKLCFLICVHLRLSAAQKNCGQDAHTQFYFFVFCVLLRKLRGYLYTVKLIEGLVFDLQWSM
jgi:hypothetical protein